MCQSPLAGRKRRHATGEADLSPRARGNLHVLLEICAVVGPIPASAGEPQSRGPVASRSWAYPRARGGTGIPRPTTPCSMGLSPRARGNQCHRRAHRRQRWPIPASAGEPAGPAIRPTRKTGLSPRARGNRIDQIAYPPRTSGLSPRARGNPDRLAARFRRGRAYPRERGGTLGVSLPALAAEGLSPRARGNLSSAAQTCGRRWAYPRERGGTMLGKRAAGRGGGPIPASAGEPAPRRSPRCVQGPIPASAGEPRSTSHPWCSEWGLSPRARGNHDDTESTR